MKKIKTCIFAAAAFLILPIYGVSWILFKTAVCRSNKGPFSKSKKTAEDSGKSFSDFHGEIENGRNWFFSQKRERITITSGDGLRLVAYYLPAKEETNKVLILMHGYRNDGLGDFSGLVEFYHSMGYHLLVPHQRSHGESEGDYICYGVKERFDLKQWAEYLVRRFDGHCTVYLSGISMGGATVLMAAGLKLPEQVKGIIADCAFTSPWDILTHVTGSDFYLPRFPFLYIADLICRRKAGYSFRECSAVSCMKYNTVPVLFIHGDKDTFVPTGMSHKNYEACAAPKELLIVAGAAHGTSHLVAPEVYRRTVVEFMRKWDK